jgi:hypothetical protein
MTIVCHPLAGRCRVGSVSDGMPEFIFLDRDIGSVTFIKLMSVRAGISSPVEFFLYIISELFAPPRKETFIILCKQFIQYRN